jgi:adenylate cyclase
MAQEIEHKFLVNQGYEPFVTKKYPIIQGYLSSVPERSVRVRIIGKKAFITVKGIGNKSGLSRYEWEQPIELIDARDLLKICEPEIIEKTRCIVKVGEHEFEIDEFHGANNGLIVAEIELGFEGEKFTKPAWLGKEVTGDVKYYNLMLSKTPYSQW